MAVLSHSGGCAPIILETSRPLQAEKSVEAPRGVLVPALRGTGPRLHAASAKSMLAVCRIVHLT